MAAVSAERTGKRHVFQFHDVAFSVKTKEDPKKVRRPGVQAVYMSYALCLMPAVIALLTCSPSLTLPLLARTGVDLGYLCQH